LPHLAVGSPRHVAAPRVSQVELRDLLEAARCVEARSDLVSDRLIGDEAVSVSGVPRAHRSDWARRQVAYVVADAHLLAPKLRTLSSHDTAAAAHRNDGWNALERVRLLDLARQA
jgi:hypothetical protein